MQADPDDTSIESGSPPGSVTSEGSDDTSIESEDRAGVTGTRDFLQRVAAKIRTSTGGTAELNHRKSCERLRPITRVTEEVLAG